MTQRFQFNELTQISNVADPTDLQDAATKAYVDARDSSISLDTFAPIAGDLVTSDAITTGASSFVVAGTVTTSFPNGLEFTFGTSTTVRTVTAATAAGGSTTVQFTPAVTADVPSGTAIMVVSKAPFTEVAAGANVTMTLSGKVLTVSATGGGGTPVPYIQFTSSETPSAGQIFTDEGLSAYNSDATKAVVAADGAVLVPNTDYTFGVNTLTVSAWLSASSVIGVVPVGASGGGSGGGYTEAQIRDFADQEIAQNVGQLVAGGGQPTNRPDLATFKWLNNGQPLEGYPTLFPGVTDGNGYIVTGVTPNLNVFLNFQNIPNGQKGPMQAMYNFFSNLGVFTDADTDSWTDPDTWVLQGDGSRDRAFTFKYNTYIALQAAGSVGYGKVTTFGVPTGQMTFQYFPSTSTNASTIQVFMQSITGNMANAPTGAGQPIYFWQDAGEHFDFVAPAQREIESIVRSQQFLPNVAANSATWTNNVAGTFGNAFQVVGGNGITVDTNAVNQPRLNVTGWAPANGWTVSISWGFDNLFGPYPGWTSNSALPVFLVDGTVTTRTGINGGAYLGPTRDWLSGDQAAYAALVSGIYRDWHNSFPDALQITSITPYSLSGSTLTTAALPTGARVTQTDNVVQALFNVTNPNAGPDFVNGMEIGDGIDLGPYVRASTGGLNLADTTLRESPTTVWNQTAWSTGITPIANSAIDARVNSNFIRSARAGEAFISRRIANTTYTTRGSTNYTGDLFSWTNANSNTDIFTIPNLDTTATPGGFRNTANYIRVFSVGIQMTFQGAASNINQVAVWVQAGDSTTVTGSTPVRYGFTTKENLGTDAILRTNVIVYVGPNDYFSTWYYCTQNCNFNGTVGAPSVYGMQGNVQNRIIIREI